MYCNKLHYIPPNNSLVVLLGTMDFLTTYHIMQPWYGPYWQSPPPDEQKLLFNRIISCHLSIVSPGLFLRSAPCE